MVIIRNAQGLRPALPHRQRCCVHGSAPEQEFRKHLVIFENARCGLGDMPDGVIRFYRGFI